MLLRMQYPPSVAKLRTTGRDAPRKPKLYRACTICRKPVFGPKVERKATGIVVRRPKKMMTSEESLRLKPKTTEHHRFGLAAPPKTWVANRTD